MLGISINALTGDNGILNRGKTAATKTNAATLKEELELEIAELKFNSVENSTTLTRQEIVDRFNEIGAEVIDNSGGIIEGEYKNHEYTVDEYNHVTIGGQLTGAVPTAIFELSTTEEGVEKLELKVIASIAEGEIASIETLDGLELVSENGTAEKTYKVEMNGEYKFKIIGTNNRRARVVKTITNLQNVIVSESLLAGIGTIKSSGDTKVRVTGKMDTNETTETYKLNVIYYKGNLNIGEKLTSDGNEITLDGLTKNGTTWSMRKNNRYKYKNNSIKSGWKFNT